MTALPSSIGAIRWGRLDPAGVWVAPDASWPRLASDRAVFLCLSILLCRVIVWRAVWWNKRGYRIDYSYDTEERAWVCRWCR